jgi:flagellar biosynthesis protein FlhB
LAEAPGGEKTHDPTAKKLSDAAKKGDIFQSRELGTALVMAAGAGWLMLSGPMMIDGFTALLREGLTVSRDELAIFDPAAATIRLLSALGFALLLLFGLTLVAALGAQALLGSLGLRGSAIAFKGDRINPLAGIKRMFGAQGLAELGKSIAKVVLVGVAGWLVFDRQADRINAPVQMDIAAAAAQLGSDIAVAMVILVAALLLIALVDVPAQYALRQKRLKMSFQEVRDEHKQAEGSPENKAAIRRRQHAILSQSTRKAVAEATVILTNPTHFAVALRYRPGEDAVPLVVARARGATAEAIRDLAGDNDVPILSSPQLTRAIYYTSRAGEPIREDLYRAVAVVLAFVFNLDAAQRAAADARPVDAPPVDVPQTMRFDSDGRPE